MEKKLINRLGLLGIVSLLSYTAAVVLSPLAYPGYDWKSQAVSDLSAANAPSLTLWTQLSSLYGPCGIACVTLVCIFIQGRLNRPARIGIYLFAVMQWVSAVGYSAFPLSDSGYSEAAQDLGDAAAMMLAGPVQDTMHLVVTVAVIALSIASLLVVIVGGYRGKQYVSLAVWAAIAMVLMLMGGVGVGAAPKEAVGIFERFSVFAAAGFNAVLGVYLFRGFGTKMKTDER
ncbi:MAG: DUF998 domain-containing protein [Clostridiales bacterium]|nr:DUF998 domain-containing protein [Clostridiales bacterium]